MFFWAEYRSGSNARSRFLIVHNDMGIAMIGDYIPFASWMSVCGEDEGGGQEDVK